MSMADWSCTDKQGGNKSMNRVVITGYGVTSPIGNDAESFLEKTGLHPLQNLTPQKQASL